MAFANVTHHIPTSIHIGSSLVSRLQEPYWPEALPHFSCLRSFFLFVCAMVALPQLASRQHISRKVLLFSFLPVKYGELLTALFGSPFSKSLSTLNDVVCLKSRNTSCTFSDGAVLSAVALGLYVTANVFDCLAPNTRPLCKREKSSG